MAPTTKTCTCCQTRLENSGANTSIMVVNSTGRFSIGQEQFSGVVASLLCPSPNFSFNPHRHVSEPRCHCFTPSFLDYVVLQCHTIPEIPDYRRLNRPLYQEFWRSLNTCPFCNEASLSGIETVALEFTISIL